MGCLVPLETAIQETIEYCRERKAFGQSLLDNQCIHYRNVQRVMMGGFVKCGFSKSNSPNLTRIVLQIG